LTRIILDTDALVAGGARKKLDLKIKGTDYSLRTGETINEVELNEIEVLLFGSREKWLSKEKLAKMPNLRLIQTFSAGVDYLKFEDIPEKITICGNVGAFSEPIAEHVFAMILAFAKQLFVHQQELSNERFNHHQNHLFLKEKNITILGTGGIGQAVVRIANCFQMNTFGVNTTGKEVTGFRQVTTLSNLDELLPISDVVVIALPLTFRTRGLINSSKLNKMKEDAILVNVARGAIIVEKELFDYLSKHPKFRAASDVWWRSRPKSTEEKFTQNYPFFQLPNFIGTPHISGDVPESYDIASMFAIENIIRYLGKESLKGIADRKDYLGM